MFGHYMPTLAGFTNPKMIVLKKKENHIEGNQRALQRHTCQETELSEYIYEKSSPFYDSFTKDSDYTLHYTLSHWFEVHLYIIINIY